MSFFDRLSNGWTISMNSFKVIKENKSLLIFPVLSGIAMLFILGTFIAGMLAAAGWDIDSIETPTDLTAYGILFLYYLVSYFIAVFFNMALIHCTKLYFQGEVPTVQQGLQFSLSKIGAIFSWAVFAATVGTILKVIQEESGVIGKIVTGLLGLVWSIATFFVVPVIAYEDLGPIDAFKRSTQIMKEKWGESISSNFSFGLVQFIAMLLVIAVAFIIGSFINMIAGIIIGVLGVLFIMTVISAAQTVFISAVYHNINGDPVKHFQEENFNNLFETKKKTLF